MISPTSASIRSQKSEPMSQSIISVFLNIWLVAAVGLFIAIIFAVFRPDARKQMDQHARIPLEDDGGQQ